MGESGEQWGSVGLEERKLAKVVVEDRARILAAQPVLNLAVGELIKNCDEQGAMQVKVVVEGRTITIEDDLRYTKQELERRLTNLNDVRPQSQKDRNQRTVKGTPGGVGVRWVRDLLQTNFGKNSILSYQGTEARGIKACIVF